MMEQIRDLNSLLACVQSGQRVKYLFFWGHILPPGQQIGKQCFSQWWECSFEIDDIKYFSAEHFMMAEKARLFNDQKTLEKILVSRHPGEAKKLGRTVKGFSEAIWESERYRIVVKGNLAKFEQNKDLGDFLIQTKNRVLVEASPRDRIWGIGLSSDHPNVDDPTRWRGLNLLGFALMETRRQLLETDN